MSKHKKPLKKTVKTGLRPLPPNTIDVFSQKKIDQWEKRIDRILNGNSLSSKDNFLLNYSLEVCRFRLAFENKEDTNAIHDRIKEIAEEVGNFELDSEDLQAINRLFRDKKKDELERLLERLESKAKTN